MKGAHVLAVLVIALVFGSSSGALGQSQTPFEDGQVVQAPDGSLFLVEGGELHPIQAVPVTDEQIQTAPMGAPVSTGLHSAQPTPAPSNPSIAATATPAPAQPGIAEAFGVRITILQVQRPYLGDVRPRAGFEWLLMRLRFENLREGPLLISSPRNAMRLQDQSGGTWDWLSGSDLSIIPAIPATGVAIQAGASFEGNVAFGVPQDRTIVKLLWTVAPGQVIEVSLP